MKRDGKVQNSIRKIEIDEVLQTLAQTRPIFHSEADFQHSLAWEIRNRFEDCSVRLELPFQKEDGALHLDIWTTRSNRFLAIELKYKTRKITVEKNDEKFCLRDQSAQDIGRYDFLKDIERLEHVVTHRHNCAAYAILLTNDSSYWKAPRSNQTVYENFRLEQSRTLHGTLRWAQHAGAGTTMGREQPVRLDEKYVVNWRDYSELETRRYGVFRYLAIKIPQTLVDEL